MIHVFVVPLVAFGLAPAPETPSESRFLVARFGETLLRNAMDVAMALWFCFLGASIGSFLNVVVYRMPLGRSLVRRGSYCPHCRVPIRSRDNLPVFGWLKLRGRCRACRLPISSRYPIVEAITASVFLLLFLVEVATDGLNLPERARDVRLGITWVILDARWDILGLYLFHVTLLSLLISAALIRYDRNALPMKLVIFGLVAGCLAPLAWPSVYGWLSAYAGIGVEEQVSLFPLNWSPAFELAAVRGVPVNDLMTCVVGAACGMLIGCPVGWVARRSNPDAADCGCELTSSMMILAWVGAYLGWQSVLSVAWIASVGMLLGLPLARSRPGSQMAGVPPAAFVAGAVLVHLVLWRALFHMPLWPGAATELGWKVVQLLLVICVTVFAVAVYQRFRRSESL